jgi:hypothetical protein
MYGVKRDARLGELGIAVRSNFLMIRKWVQRKEVRPAGFEPATLGSEGSMVLS